jgi:hypothetical protein
VLLDAGVWLLLVLTSMVGIRLLVSLASLFRFVSGSMFP